MRADDVAGAEILDPLLLLAVRPEEEGRVVGMQAGELLGVHRLEDGAGGGLRRGKAALGVVGQIEGDLRARQAEAILRRRRERDGIARIGRLLDQEAEPELARQLVVQFLDQRGAEQRLAAAGLADVPAVDQVDRGRVGVLDREVPALVADLDAEGGAVLAEVAVAADFDAARRQRPAIAPYRLVREGPGKIEW